VPQSRHDAGSHRVPKGAGGEAPHGVEKDFQNHPGKRITEKDNARSGKKSFSLLVFSEKALESKIQEIRPAGATAPEVRNLGRRQAALRGLCRRA